MLMVFGLVRLRAIEKKNTVPGWNKNKTKYSNKVKEDCSNAEMKIRLLFYDRYLNVILKCVVLYRQHSTIFYRWLYFSYWSQLHFYDNISNFIPNTMIFFFSFFLLNCRGAKCKSFGAAKSDRISIENLWNRVETNFYLKTDIKRKTFWITFESLELCGHWIEI